ncbi:restriction endonuclease [Thermus scotoductus]|uniref:Restriction endonuclease n=1 Tax=Thermus scotoductus TaxID=37636 RepID=A0ABY0AH01_THESC|nr:restriction endonuclease subunit S [Thermus scotoductus]RTH16244.1 restriction endonuclease [Thermus scotoductus]RTH31011.1 restriction endonuclease [Thermus scotoductus]RTI06092.1 restriction endonuclease [Thermus scotoductus]RTI12665.1 restriction endonuclease [Thermus scotoductus]
MKIEAIPAEATRFKETELGPLPEEWRVVRLGEVFDIQQGKALSRKKDKGLRPRPFLRTANVFWGRLDLSNLDQMDFSEEEEKKYALKPGDLLVCEGGDVGRTAIWEGQLKNVYYQNHLHRLRAKSQDVEPRVVMYWMQASMTLLGLYLGTSNKTTIPNLSRSRLASFAIPLPPLPEQRAIAYVLRTVQESKEATERVITVLRELKKSLMRHLFTYGPVPVDAIERVELQETEIGPLPAHWRVVRLGEVVKDSFSGGTPSTKKPEYWGGNIPWTTSAILNEDDIFLSRFQRTITELGLDRSASKTAPKGSLIVGTRVGVGKAAVAGFDIAISQDLTALVLKSNVEALFAAYLFKSAFLQEQIRERTRGTTIKGIPRRDLLSILIPLPPLSEQREIARMLQAVDARIEAEEKKKAALEALFKTLLHHLMTAKIRLPEEFVARFAEATP